MPIEHIGNRWGIRFMEYKLPDNKDLDLMENILNDDNMNFSIDYLINFIKNKNTYGFIAREKEKIIGFAYGYSILRPDGKSFSLSHSVALCIFVR